MDNKKKIYIDKKIEKNKTFLKNLTFYNEDYKLVSMFDSDLNANLSPERYFAEVNNRVNTMFKIAQELALSPIFLTITAPSAYHPSSKEYNHFKPRETALYLSDIWRRFLNLMIFRNIKKNSGHKMIYIRVYEPHKSGVPHLHAMLFIPKEYLSDVKNKFYEHYLKYGFKKVGLKFISKFDKSVKYDGATGAIAYILKYMNKTFRNAKDGLMSDEAYYFAYYGIRRFTTSQTLIPLWIYRKIKHNENCRDLLKLTKEYKEGHIYTCFDKEYIIQRFLKKERVEYDIDDIENNLSVEEKVLYQKNHFIANQFQVSKKVYEEIPKQWTKQKQQIPVFTDTKLTHYYFNGKFIPYRKHITDMSDFELLNYYDTYDVDNDDYIYYLATKNLLISRNLLNGEIYNLNNFSLDKYFVNVNKK